MRRGKSVNYKLALIVALIVSTVAITIGYASFSEALKINGDATVNHSSWVIKFTNLQPASLNGTAEDITPPQIDTKGTTLSGYNVKFTTPGDSVSYTFDVANEGTFKGKISSLDIATPICTGNGDNAVNDASNVCNHLLYTLTYSDGTTLSVGDIVNSATSKTLLLTLTYKDDITAEELPNNDVAVSNLAVTINYGQTL